MQIHLALCIVLKRYAQPIRKNDIPITSECLFLFGKGFPRQLMAFESKHEKKSLKRFMKASMEIMKIEIDY